MHSGFIPYSRASLVFDVLFVSLPILLFVVIGSLVAIAYGYYRVHKGCQLASSLALGIVLLYFEMNIRLSGWTHLATPSPYYHTLLFPFLYLHIGVASISLFLWGKTLWMALRRFPNPPIPGVFSPTHRVQGKWAVGSLVATVGTGWIFYWMAFVA
jgi:putative membrane protein